jgi:hypothetical protein
MVGYTQFSRDSAPADRKKLWNPSKTLGIINMDPGYQCITCIGYAPSQRRRCRNPIRKDNRDFITETLDEIAYLHPNNPAVMSRLRAIASPALCVRYHQNQDETVLKQWQSKIQQLPDIEDSKPARSIKSSKKQEPERDESKDALKEQLREMRELLARLQEEINSQRYQDQKYQRVDEQLEKDREEEESRRWRREEKDKKAKRQEKERLEKERLEKERLEKERLEKERREREEKKRRESEQAASNERIRTRAQKLRQEREREERETKQKEREEWGQSWTKYQERWVRFKASTSREGDFRDAIPWPVKSGSYRDVKASNVKEFFERAVPKDANMARVMRKECQKWHPDMINRLPRSSQLTDVDRMMVDMICREITKLLNASADRSAQFLG